MPFLKKKFNDNIYYTIYTDSWIISVYVIRGKKNINRSNVIKKLSIRDTKLGIKSSKKIKSKYHDTTFF